MDLVDRIKEISTRIEKQKTHVQTEEGTKNAFVMPFIIALGYDVFNPSEVIPEFIADVGTKKGEKVDYAIKKDDNIIILIECKTIGTNLNHPENYSQLIRYFSITRTRFGILTNGIEYQFFSDLDNRHEMDKKPFFEFNISNFEEHQIEELKKFTKSSFDLENIISTANSLKYTGAIKKIFSDQLSNPLPDEDFTKYFVSKVYVGRITQSVLEQFSKIVKEALNQFLRERLNNSLKSALNEAEKSAQAKQEEAKVKNLETEDFLTTDAHLEGFHIIKAILRETIDIKRITLRNTKSYCGVLFDDNNRKPITRMYFNTSQKYISVFSQKNEEKIPITDLNEIFKSSDRLKSTVLEYLSEQKNVAIEKQNLDNQKEG